MFGILRNNLSDADDTVTDPLEIRWRFGDLSLSTRTHTLTLAHGARVNDLPPRPPTPH